MSQKCGSKVVREKNSAKNGRAMEGKEEIRCPKCNAVIQPDKKFCGECGSLFKEQVPVEKPQSKVCPNCVYRVRKRKEVLWRMRK